MAGRPAVARAPHAEAPPDGSGTRSQPADRAGEDVSGPAAGQAGPLPGPAPVGRGLARLAAASPEASGEDAPAGQAGRRVAPAARARMRPAPGAVARTPAPAPAPAGRGLELARAVGGELVQDADGTASVAFPAPFDPPAALGPYVARWPEPADAPAPAPAPAPAAGQPAVSPPTAASPAPAAPAIDVDQLAEDVLSRLRDQLELDHERRNGRFF